MASTAAVYLRPLMRLLERRGLDPDALLAGHGLRREELMRADLRLDVAVTRALLEEACTLTGEPALGLSLARYARYEAFGPLGVALAAGGSLRSVLARITRYHAVVSDAVTSRLIEQDDRLVVEFSERTTPAPHPQSILFVMASISGLVRVRLSPEVSPRSVALREVDERCRLEAERAFRCRVTVGPRWMLEYGAGDGHALFQASDPEMAGMLEQALGARLAATKRPLSVKLALFLQARLPEGEPPLSDAARALRTSTRSLQRRLREEGLTWRSVVDDTRRALVERHLTAPEMSLTRLAFLLGFADVSSFSRAFRRWYGVSASDYRKRG